MVFTAARINSGHPLAGQSYELDAIAAVVIGGTSLFRGEGTIIGTFIGTNHGVIRNGLNLINVDPYWQQVAIELSLLPLYWLTEEARLNVKNYILKKVR